MTNESLEDDHDKLVASNRKSVVAGRWKLLRDALRGKPISRKPTFGGYDMVPSQKVDHQGEVFETLRERLSSITASTDATLTDTLETSILGLQALDKNHSHSQGCRDVDHCFSISTRGEMDLKLLDLSVLSHELCQRCELDSCEMHWDLSRAKNGGNDDDVLRIRTTSTSQNRFLIRRYDLSVDNRFLLVRERSTEQVISLAELTSHHRGHAIDNTGNVCVWDCEKTLLWALLSATCKKPTNKFGRVLELGAGMAGLVALGLAAANRASHVVVSDGNPGSLQSNRTHVRLMEVVNPLQCIVDPCLLPWALSASEECNAFKELKAEPANLSVVSDCTHFERYHGHLFWTLLQCTTVGGQIWMCHPNRGKTLERFLDIVRMFSGVQTDDSLPQNDLLSWTELSFPELENKHHGFEKNEPDYRPDVHRPRVFRLSKLRDANERDRDMVIQHMSTRDL